MSLCFIYQHKSFATGNWRLLCSCTCIPLNILNYGFTWNKFNLLLKYTQMAKEVCMYFSNSHKTLDINVRWDLGFPTCSKIIFKFYNIGMKFTSLNNLFNSWLLLLCWWDEIAHRFPEKLRLLKSGQIVFITKLGAL